MNKTKMIRQGDVLVMRTTKAAAKGFKPAALDARGVVLAEGEATGHCHRIQDPGVCMLVREGAAFDVDRMLSIGIDRAELSHDEHSTIGLSGGTYVVRRQREFDWVSASSRAVAD